MKMFIFVLYANITFEKILASDNRVEMNCEFCRAKTLLMTTCLSTWDCGV